MRKVVTNNRLIPVPFEELEPVNRSPKVYIHVHLQKSGSQVDTPCMSVSLLINAKGWIKFLQLKNSIFISFFRAPQG